MWAASQCLSTATHVCRSALLSNMAVFALLSCPCFGRRAATGTTTHASHPGRGACKVLKSTRRAKTNLSIFHSPAPLHAASPLVQKPRCVQFHCRRKSAPKAVLLGKHAKRLACANGRPSTCTSRPTHVRACAIIHARPDLQGHNLHPGTHCVARA